MYAILFFFDYSCSTKVGNKHGVLISTERPSGLDKDTGIGGLEVPSVTLSALIMM